MGGPAYFPYPTPPFGYGGIQRSTAAASGSAGATAGELYFANLGPSTAIANLNVETAFSIAPIIPAGILGTPGTTVKFEVSGLYSTTGTPTMTVRCRISLPLTGVITAQTTPIMGTNATLVGWTFSGGFIVQSVISSLVLPVPALSMFQPAGGGTPDIRTGASGTQIIAGGALANTLFFTALWGTASPSNSIQMTTCLMWIFVPRSAS